MAKKNTEEKKVGTLFSLRKAVEVSDGMMQYKANDELFPVRITEGGSKAVQSQDSKEELKNVGNIVYGERAQIPHGSDTLVLSFSGKVLSIQDIPTIADGYHLGNEKKVKTSSYIDLIGELKTDKRIKNDFDLLSEAFLFNILNASWAFRNKEIANKVSVTILLERGNERVVLKTNEAKGSAIHATYVDENKKPSVHNLFTTIDGYSDAIDMISDTLRKTVDDVILFTVTAELEVGDGAIVYPSQLFLPGEKQKQYAQENGKRNSYAKELYRSVTFGDDNVAGISSDKIWNAIRTIDAFHGNKFNIVSAIEPNGANSQFAIELRGTKNNFYAYKNIWLMQGLDVLIDETSNKPGDMVYFIGTLVRGGVLGNAK